MLAVLCIIGFINILSAFMCGSMWLGDGSKKTARLTLLSVFFGFIMWPIWMLYHLLASAFGKDE